jgi:hypothetical protein
MEKMSFSGKTGANTDSRLFLALGLGIGTFKGQLAALF